VAAVRIGDNFREDGTIYVPGPDASFHPYYINNPSLFRPNKNNTEPRHFTASMIWSSTGSVYDRAPAFSVLCLSVDGASIDFYTDRTSQPNTIVKFDFYPPLHGPAPVKAAPLPAENPAS
jgi:hypothetical protein